MIAGLVTKSGSDSRTTTTDYTINNNHSLI